jgi:UDPglucose--hexose-1-phosphate uridylyltransferase
MVSFERIETSSTFLDPRKNFQEVTVPFDIRIDPLTGKSGRIAHFVHPPAITPDFASMKALSLSRGCPFCPDKVKVVTPKFLPEVVREGNIVVGKAVSFPNLSPYDEYSAVTVMTGEHMVLMNEWTSDMLEDALLAALSTLKAVDSASRLEGKPRYSAIIWNYMPPSGGTQVHPHLQILNSSVPTCIQRDEKIKAEAYLNETGRSLWSDYVESEVKSGDRLVFKGPEITWLTSFMPRGLLGEIIAVFTREYQGIHDSPSGNPDCPHVLKEFIDGLLKVMSFFHDEGIWSLNMALLPGTGSDGQIPAHVRIIPRMFLHPILSSPDMNALQVLLDESLSFAYPEEMAKRIAPYFT